MTKQVQTVPESKVQNDLGKIVDKYIIPRTIKKRELFALRWGMYGELEDFYRQAQQEAVKQFDLHSDQAKMIVRAIASGIVFDEETGLLRSHWIDSCKKWVEEDESLQTKGSHE